MTTHFSDTQFEFFPWNSHFLVHIDFIDQQHRQLVYFLNKAAWNYVTSGNDERSFDELIAYAHYHFEEEEALWHRYFPDKSLTNHHDQSHRDFFERIRAIQSDNATESSRSDQLIEFLSSWLVVHILHSDRLMATMVREVENNNLTFAEAEQKAKTVLEKTSLLQGSLVQLYKKLAMSAAQLVREKNARIQAEDDYHQLIQENAEKALEMQALEYQNHLEFLAYNDPMTGLLNRNGLVKKLKHLMKQVTTEASNIAVVSIDLDFFSETNSKVGNEWADRMLGILARRWQDAILPQGALARTGGDEFVVLVKHADLLETQLAALRLSAAQPFLIDQWNITLSFTAGVRFYQKDFAGSAIDPDVLLRQADFALYQAKQDSRGKYRVFDAIEEIKLRERNQLIEEIDHGLLRSQFVLYYQPKIDMAKGDLIGAEALIRWQHPERGLLQPGEFLPVLENHTLIIQLGEWVIEQALCQLDAWDRIDFVVNLSINIDALQIQSVEFPERLKNLLNRYDHINPGRIDLEILETAAISDLEKAIHNIQKCKALGVTFSLDDFGKGYSSLSYLQQLPVDTLKIDQGFVRGVWNDPKNVSILEGIIALGNAFDLKLIAEGVESINHGELLIQLGCVAAQGYAIAKPMVPELLLIWHRSWRPSMSWQQSHRLRREDVSALVGLLELNAFFSQSKQKNETTMRPGTSNDYRSKSFELWIREKFDSEVTEDLRLSQIERSYDEFKESAKRIFEASHAPTEQTELSELNVQLEQLDQQVHNFLRKSTSNRRHHQ